MVTDDRSSDWKVMEYPDHNINGKAVSGKTGKSELTKLKVLL